VLKGVDACQRSGSDGYPSRGDVPGSASSTRPQAAAQQRERHAAGRDELAHRATTKGIDGVAERLKELPVWRDVRGGFGCEFQKSPSNNKKAKNREKLTGKFSGLSQGQRHGAFSPGQLEFQVPSQLRPPGGPGSTHGRSFPYTYKKPKIGQNLNV
jgi:hypothetical protein